MDWTQAALLGACGGAVIEIVTFWRNVDMWRNARREALAKGKKRLPRFNGFFDVPADLLAFLTRLALGAIAGGLLHEQVVGSLAGVMVGASAPAVLLQLGSARSIARAAVFDPVPVPSATPDPAVTSDPSRGVRP